jgi:hypothetical protein
MAPFMYDVLGHTGRCHAAPSGLQFAGHQWWSKFIARAGQDAAAHNATAFSVVHAAADRETS